MADIRYDVSQLFKMVFGVNNPVFITRPLNENPPINISFSGIDVIEDFTQIDAISWMGTPIVSSATLKGGSYFKYKQDGQLERVQMADLVMPAATMYNFRRAKNITRTNVLGSNGTVKEIYGFDDWVIDVRGLCLDEPGKSAQQQLNEILAYEGLADGIEITGSQFDLRGVRRISIGEWYDNIPQGQPGVIAFQAQMLSDEPVEFGLPKYEIE